MQTTIWVKVVQAFHNIKPENENAEKEEIVWENKRTFRLYMRIIIAIVER